MESWRWWNSSRAISDPERWCCESAALNIPANLENLAVATGKGQFSFQFQRKTMPKNVQTTTQLHLSHTLVKCKVILKVLWASLQQYVKSELPDVQAWFRKGRGTRDQIANICWIMEKVREFQKNIYFCFIDYTKAFDCVDQNKLENS